VSTGLINLLPKEEKKRDIRGVVLNIFMVLAIILLVVVILLSVFIFDIDNVLSARLAEYQNVNIKLQDQVRKLKVYDDFSAQITEKRNLIEEFKKDEVLWSKIIYDLGRSMPEDASLDTFNAQGSSLYSYLDDYREGEAEEGKQVISFSITGEAREYTDVLRLVIELNKIDNLDLVWMQSINNITNPATDGKIISFIINTYWDLDYFIEKTGAAPEESSEEDVLDSELEDLES
jgi:hypothetical protein